MIDRGNIVAVIIFLSAVTGLYALVTIVAAWVLSVGSVDVMAALTGDAGGVVMAALWVWGSGCAILLIAWVFVLYCIFSQITGSGSSGTGRARRGR